MLTCCLNIDHTSVQSTLKREHDPIQTHLQLICHNLSLRLVTKAKAYNDAFLSPLLDPLEGPTM